MSITYGVETPDDGWVKIFQHKVTGGYFNSSNVTNLNATNPNADLYSQLYKLGDMKLAGEYVLKMVMDNYTNIWAQTHNPLLDVNPNASTVPGYRAISIGTSANSWGGLSLGSSGAAYLDGNPANSNWYYPIGSYQNWNGGMPQYDSTGHPTVELWVKIK